MSPRRTPATSGKRVPYRAPRDRRELWTAIAVASLIVIATMSLVWFLRPNRDSGSTTTDTNPVTFHTVPTTPPTAATAAPTDTTAAAPTDTTTAPAGG